MDRGRRKWRVSSPFLSGSASRLYGVNDDNDKNNKATKKLRQSSAPSFLTIYITLVEKIHDTIIFGATRDLQGDTTIISTLILF